MTERKLPRTAYEIEEGQTYVPYTHGQSLAEFTLKPIVTGVLLGMVFGMANTYLGLKAGLTISTSIPVAVLTKEHGVLPYAEGMACATSLAGRIRPARPRP